MKFHEALKAVRSNREKCITLRGRSNFHVYLKENQLIRNDGIPMPMEFFTDPEFYTRDDFEVISPIPEGWCMSAQGQVVKPSQCERWINLYYDRNTKEYLERDHREQRIANHEITQMAKGSIVFLRQLHTVTQYTLTHEQVFGVPETELRFMSR